VDLPFLDVPVDPVSVSETLRNATVLLVGSTSDIDYLNSVFNWCNVTSISFERMKDMEAAISSSGFLSPDKSYVCFVDEELYEDDAFELLKNVREAFLITFGPKHTHSQSAYHFHFPSQVMPSALLQSVVDCISPPANEPGPNPLQKSETVTTAEYRDWNILVAEDNIINQKVLLRMLRQMGFEYIDVVDNGQKAVEYESVRQYDIVLMDVFMPVKDGVDATKEIMERRVGGHAKPKIVFVTAHASTSFQSQCLESGAAGYLAKPYSIRDLDRCFRGLSAPAKTVQSHWKNDRRASVA